MGSIWFLVPGSLGVRTGGSIYNRRMARALRALGHEVHVRELDDSFPRPTAEALVGARHVLRAIPDGAMVVVDGLAFSTMPDLAEQEAPRLALVALVHLARRADPADPPGTRAGAEAAEGRALRAARGVIVTGSTTPDSLGPYGLLPEAIQVVAPGADRHELPEPSTATGGPVRVLCVATVNAGKGHDVLLEALATLPREGWRLTCAGSLSRDVAAAARVQALAQALGIADRVTFAGDLTPSALDAAFREADVFALATRAETYGMAVAEAISYGLPVVATRTGDIPSFVGTDAGLLVPPDEPEAFTTALARLIGDPALRVALAHGARRAAAALPTWPDAAARFWTALTRICP
ncbi:MAG: glycosyltransferase family 4 protein [Vicinamibacterales bacterium]